MKQKTVTAVGPFQVELVERELGALDPKSVRARALLSGISHGTEMNLVSGESPFRDMQFDGERRIFVPAPEGRGLYPCSLGYDSVAEVVEVGAEVTGFKPGDRVWTAKNHQDVYDFPGEGYAYRIPDGVANEEAIFGHLAQVALYATHDAEIKVGDRVAVFGLGAIGQMVVQLARLSGAQRIAAVDPLPARRELAVSHGADLLLDPTEGEVAERIIAEFGGSGVDVAIESSANPSALHEAIRSVAQCGSVVALGYYRGDAAGLFLGREWHHNRITMRSSMAVWGCDSRFAPLWNTDRAKRTLLELMRSKRLDVSDFPVQKVPFAEAASAYDLIRRENPLKVALEY